MITEELWAAWWIEPTESTRNALVEHYQPWLKKLTGYVFKNLSGLGMEFVDCLNSANLGLIESIERFDRHHGGSFETYASYRVKGSIYNSVDDYAPEISKYLFHQSKKSELSQFSAARLKKVGIYEIAEEMILEEMLFALSGYQNVDESIVNNYLHLDDFLLIRQLNMKIDELYPEEQMVVRYYYFHDYSLKDISAIIGVSKARVSQIKRTAIECLLNRLESSNQ
jgi:RNA polymerase sigma factor for flagellar operon FliA